MPTRKMQEVADGLCHRIMPSGENCKRHPRKGALLCPAHGGDAPGVIKAAEVRNVRDKAQVTAAKRMARARGQLDLDIIAELERNAIEAVVFKDVIREQMEAVIERMRYEGKTGEQIRAEIIVYERAMDRVNKHLIDIYKLGLEEKKIAIAKEQAALVALALRAILTRLELTPEQQRLAPIIVKEEMLAISSGSD